jgi:hypothetical protein
VGEASENRIARNTADENYSDENDFWYGSNEIGGYLGNVGVEPNNPMVSETRPGSA